MWALRLDSRPAQGKKGYVGGKDTPVIGVTPCGGPIRTYQSSNWTAAGAAQSLPHRDQGATRHSHKQFIGLN